MDKKVTEFEFEFNNKKEYKMEAIWNSAVYVNKIGGHLPALYYVIAWKRYAKKEDIWEPLSAI